MSTHEGEPPAQTEDEEETSFEANLVTLTADEAASLGERATDTTVVLEFEEV